MKLTANRKLILRLLDDALPDCGLPPYSASDLHWALHQNGMAEWYAKQDGVAPPKTLPSIQQIHRTLRDLASEGLIVAEYQLNDGGHNQLPQKVAYWQLAASAERNATITACNKAHNRAKTAKFGINLFGATIDQGLPADAVTALEAEIEGLLEQTTEGFEDERAMLVEALGWIRSGIIDPELRAKP